MRQGKLYGIVLMLFLGLTYCSSEKKSTDVHQQEEKPASTVVEWKEMDEFHSVMADSFHPYMDSTNLAPAKLNAADLARVAEKWAAAELPERVNNEEVKKMISTLNVSSQEYLKTVQTNNDEAIGESLIKLHDLFHEIQDAWYHSAEKHEH
jgi:uncharacterized FlaG/YvyC family protein